MLGHRRPPVLFVLLGLAVAATYGAVICGARAGGGGIGRSRRPAAAHEAARMNVVNLPCWDAEVGEPQTVAARYVRLTGRACARAGGRGRISVKNLTNGFEATVFEAGAALTTDYIPLRTGTNDVVIAVDRGAGRPVERVLRLTR